MKYIAPKMELEVFSVEDIMASGENSPTETPDDNLWGN